MAQVNKYIAVDLGAESGRVMAGSVWHGLPARENTAKMAVPRLDLEEIHRFGNGPIEEDGSLRWDFNGLLSEIKTGIGKAAKAAGAEVKGIGIDSWGVDFGLLDADGKLIENPYHYRDSQTNGMREKAFELMGKRAIYDNTGVQFMQLNSVYQLLAMRLNNSAALAKAANLVFVGDLFSYFLCGKIFAEYSLASTSQFMDMRTGQWSKAVLDGLSLPGGIMPKIIDPGTIVGRLTDEIATELGCGPIPVIAIGSHDTASAVVAVPAVGDANWAYLSSGTWSLMGVEVPDAIVNDKTFGYEFTNEGGVENTIRLLKNIMGLWPIQECKRQWQREGTDLSYAELAALAEKAEPFARRIDVDDGSFLAPGDMPKRINDYLTGTGQQPIDEKGQMIRAILENLALKYRSIMEAIEDVAGQSIDVLHIVGGGIQNELLCQFTANALGKKVVTGPIEATASGNILMQAKAAGQIKSLAEAREIVRNSFELKEYEPQETSAWQEQYRERQK
ncbi:MAG: rhamnulokinase [Planctomycetes bacterium B3_Pla]|nr:MAG: rhamnulokinase [Planctomycetes bacterium B3_Pla]